MNDDVFNGSEEDVMSEDDYEEEPFGYECLACGNVQDYDDRCDRCDAVALDPMY